MKHSSRIPPPLIEGLSRRYILRKMAIGLASGIAIAQAYWHFQVLPGRAERDAFFEAAGIEIEHLD